MLIHETSILAISSGGAMKLGGAIILLLFLIGLAVYFFFAYCLSKIFVKAGKPAWAGYIPICNSWIYYEVGGKPGWLVLFFLLTFIPIVNILIIIGLLVIDVLVSLEIAKRFNRSAVFGIFLLFLLPFIGVPILAFGKSKYNTPLGNNPVASPGGVPPNPVPPVQAITPQPAVNPTVAPVAPTVSVPQGSPPVVGGSPTIDNPTTAGQAVISPSPSPTEVVPTTPPQTPPQAPPTVQ